MSDHSNDADKSKRSESSENRSPQDDSLEIVVREAGARNRPRNKPQLNQSDGIEIRQSSGSIDAYEDYTPTKTPTTPPSSTIPVPDSTDPAQGKVHRLSAEEVKKIEKNLYASSSYQRDKQSSKLSSQPKGFTNAPIAPVKSAHHDAYVPVEPAQGSRPKMAERGRGIAYFTKNFIQVVGSQELRDDDELIINDRRYILRKRRFSSKTVAIAVTAASCLVLFMIGLSFVADSSGGKGWVTGIVVDNNNQPYFQGATVRFPESNTSTKSNPQGFFKSDDLEAGTHKVEYVVAGNVVGEDFVTVVAGEVATLLLQPTLTSEKSQPAETSPTKELATEEQPKQTNTPKPAPREDNPQSKPRVTTAGEYAAVTLKCNVSDAKLSLDGEVIGSGNFTFRKLRSGQHSYVVSRDGYQTVTGVITLEAGETVPLKVDLKPVAKQKSQDADLLSQAIEARNDSDPDKAIKLLTEAIELKPSFAQAYMIRGDCHHSNGEKTRATMDFLRAAEIYGMKGEYNMAFTAYNKCLAADKDNVAGYLGRGLLFMNRKETIAAVNDFETVLSMNNQNAQAHLGLGDARYSQGNYERAIKHYKDARSLDKENLVVLQKLMLAYLAEGDTKNVKRTYDQFVKDASPEQRSRMKSDKTYSAVMQVVAMEM